MSGCLEADEATNARVETRDGSTQKDSKGPSIAIVERGVIAVARPLCEAGEVSFNAVERVVRRRLGIHTAFIDLSRPNGSKFQSCFATEIRTQLGREVDAWVADCRQELVFPRTQSRLVEQAIRDTGGTPIRTDCVALSDLGTVRKPNAISDFLTSHETGTIDLPNIDSLSLTFFLQVALSLPSAVIGVLLPSGPRASQAERIFYRTVRDAELTWGLDDQTVESITGRVRFVGAGMLSEATLPRLDRSQCCERLVPHLQLLFLLPGYVLTHERVLDDLVGTSVDSSYRMFSVVDHANLPEPGVDSEITSAWLGDARLRCLKVSKNHWVFARPVRHCFLRFRSGFDADDRNQFAQPFVPDRSVVASSQRRNAFIADRASRIANGDWGGRLQADARSYLDAEPIRIAVLAENDAQARTLRDLLSQQNRLTWRTAAECLPDRFSIRRFGPRLVVTVSDLKQPDLRAALAHEFNVIVRADCGPSIPDRLDNLLKKGTTRPVALVDVRDDRNAPSEVQAWSVLRELIYRRRGWLSLIEGDR